MRSRLGSTYRLALWRRDHDRRETIRPFLSLRSTLRHQRSRGARSKDGNQAERRDGRAQPALDRNPVASIGVALTGMTTRTSMAWRKMTIIYEIQHLNRSTAKSLPVSAVAATFCPRPKRQMLQLLLRHRSTPPDAFAHDHDRQQVSWLAGHRLRPPSQRFLSIPSGIYGRRLSAYSCGGSRGFAHQCARTAFPWLALAGTTEFKRGIGLY